MSHHGPTPHASLRIVGLGGSLSGGPSSSLAALRAVLARAEKMGARVQVFDVRGMALPMYEPGAEPPAAARELAAAVREADALVWSSPMYHGTISGAFKNALDWLQLLADAKPAYLTDKPVALVATAAGAQGLQAINTMEFVVRALRGWALPLTLPIGRSFEAFTPEGEPRDAHLAKQMDLLAQELVTAARRFAPPQPAAAPAPLARA